MASRRPSPAATLALVAAAILAAPAHAQDAPLRPFASITAVYDAGADLDGGGEASVTRGSLRAGATRAFGAGGRVGVAIAYDYHDYRFDAPAAFDGRSPWGAVQRYGVSAPMGFGLRDGWSLGISPSIDVFRENGAADDDAVVFGAVITATRRFDGGNVLGIGLGAFHGIEDTSLFPVVVVDWKFNDRWRLANPLATGPTGAGGIELVHRLDNGWDVGAGAAYRKLRFRLSERGPVPSGVGEERGVPLFAKATRSFAGATVHAYAGVVLGGRLRVEDRDGNTLAEADYDPSLMLGLTVESRF
jgi:hypothetical protein